MDMIVELATINDTIKKLEKRKDELKTNLCERIGTASAIVDADGKPLITWDLKKYSRLNTELVKEQYGDVYDRCKVTSTTRNFVVKYNI